MQSATAIHNLPTMYPPLKPSGQKANAAATSSSTDAASASANDLQTTFLNLLSEELQNQDPTDPVDSTQMVGQMISLNQLDQLISINQALSEAATASAPAAKLQSAPVANASARTANAAPLRLAAPPSTTASSAHQLPFDPATMMPWNFSNPAALTSVSGAPGQTGNMINSNAGGR